MIENPEQSYVPKENNKVEENYIDIIMPKTKQVEDGEQFGNKGIFQIIPIRIAWLKKIAILYFVIGFKKIQ